MTDQPAPLLVDQDGGVLTLSVNDAPINRLSFEYMDALEEAVDQAAADPSVRVLVFTAAGTENFSVGMDLKQLQAGAGERGGPEAVLDQRLRVLARIESLPKPSIATLFGHCLGGGLELPLACHFRLAAEEGGVLTLSVNDAPINRMSFEYMDALEEAVDQAAADPSVRVLVFTAAGTENFSVGMDLKQLQAEAGERGGPEAVLDQRLRVLARIESLPKPSIATLFGYCLGGGLELPLACHFRLAAEEGARIGLPELDLGTVPAWGGTARLTRCVGRDHALDLILRAKKISGPEALRIGLVTEVHPLDGLKAAARALADELAAMPPVAVAGVLGAVVGAGDAPLDEALAAEREAVKGCARTQDQVEGMMAFLEKRPPVFTGE